MTQVDILDNATPRYLQLLDTLPKGERRVVAVLSRMGGSSKFSPLSNQCRMDSRVVSVFLGRLEKRGIIRRLSRGIWEIKDQSLVDWLNFRRGRVA